MRPPLWHPPVELSTAEHAIMKRIRRATLFVCLRQHRHALFAEAFQQELLTLYKDQPQGHPPVPPAQLALATLLHAYTQVSDDEVIEATTMDRRWQLVLDCLDCETPPFSTGTLVVFRQRLIAQQLDRRLLERTVEVAASSGAFGSRQLRAALDSSPLWGAGRVEDTSKLLGDALRKAVGVIARQQGRGLRAVAEEAGASLVAGPSLKAALDLDWDAPSAQLHALTLILDALSALDRWLDTPPAPTAVVPQVAASLAVAEQVRTQDVTAAANGPPTLRQGVAAERRISVEDGEMRHGRKSRSLLVDGYKRHVLRDLDARLVVAVGVTPANAPEASVTDAIEADIAAQQCPRRELHIDRADLHQSVGATTHRDIGYFLSGVAGTPGPVLSQVRSSWMGSARHCSVRAANACPLRPERLYTFRRPRVGAVCCGHAARQALLGAASVFIPTTPCCRSCANASRPRRGGRSCGSAWPSNTPGTHWPVARPPRPLPGSAEECV